MSFNKLKLELTVKLSTKSSRVSNERKWFQRWRRTSVTPTEASVEGSEAFSRKLSGGSRRVSNSRRLSATVVAAEISKVNSLLRAVSRPSGDGNENTDALLQDVKENLLKLETLSKQLEIKEAFTENLLAEMLPKHALRAIQQGKPVPPMDFENVTVFFSDVVGFTDMCAQLQNLCKDAYLYINVGDVTQPKTIHLSFSLSLYKV